MQTLFQLNGDNVYIVKYLPSMIPSLQSSWIGTSILAPVLFDTENKHIISHFFFRLLLY